MSSKSNEGKSVGTRASTHPNIWMHHRATRNSAQDLLAGTGLRRTGPAGMGWGGWQVGGGSWVISGLCRYKLMKLTYTLLHVSNAMLL